VISSVVMVDADVMIVVGAITSNWTLDLERVLSPCDRYPTWRIVMSMMCFVLARNSEMVDGNKMMTAAGHRCYYCY